MILLLLRITLGSVENDKLKTTFDIFIKELMKFSSKIVPYESAIDSNDIRFIIREIPFKQYKQIGQLKFQMKTRKVILALPLNFQLIEYKTEKLRMLAVLNE